MLRPYVKSYTAKYSTYRSQTRRPTDSEISSTVPTSNPYLGTHFESLQASSKFPFERIILNDENHAFELYKQIKVLTRYSTSPFEKYLVDSDTPIYFYSFLRSPYQRWY